MPEHEISWQFIRASGPGGQNVNKVATAAQLHFNIDLSSVLSNAVKTQLYQVAGNRVNKRGELVITAQTHRTQTANRQEALHRLEKFIQRAHYVPKKRIKTKPSKAAVKRGKTSKKLNSQKKQQRQSNRFSL
ncbi:MAG: aminoacyl-tRNA hydrolase [Gammaproteobacteria bacterium]|nr:aminoacyl-tRNA hydrolase [Gammaproteobacteria bacterium]